MYCIYPTPPTIIGCTTNPTSAHCVDLAHPSDPLPSFIPEDLTHRVIMYFIETKATSRLLTFGRLSFNMQSWSTHQP